MQWKVVKTALIVLFSVINLFLLAVLVNTSLQKSAAKRQMEDSVTEILSRAGITVDKSILPENPKEMKVLPVSQELYKGAGFAKRVFGTHIEETLEENGVTTYRSGAKTLKVSQGGFEFYDEGALPYARAENPDELTLRLSQMGFNLTYADSEAQGSKTVYTQSYGGYPIFRSKIEVETGSREIISLKGSWVSLNPHSGAKRVKIRPATNALMDFLREMAGARAEISAIKIGYLVHEEDPEYNGAEALPAWEITTSGGQKYYYDARER